MKRKKVSGSNAGFSLIELLVVCSILLILVAVAIPNYVKARISANETGCVASMKAIASGAWTYANLCPSTGYPPSLLEMKTGTICPNAANTLDAVVSSGTKSGYTFTYMAIGSGSVNSGYTLTATPITFGLNGYRGFYTDQSGVIRYTMDGSAPSNAASPLQ